MADSRAEVPMVGSLFRRGREALLSLISQGWTALAAILIGYIGGAALSPEQIYRLVWMRDDYVGVWHGALAGLPADLVVDQQYWDGDTAHFKGYLIVFPATTKLKVNLQGGLDGQLNASGKYGARNELIISLDRKQDAIKTQFEKVVRLVAKPGQPAALICPTSLMLPEGQSDNGCRELKGRTEFAK